MKCACCNQELERLDNTTATLTSHIDTGDYSSQSRKLAKADVRKLTKNDANTFERVA